MVLIVDTGLIGDADCGGETDFFFSFFVGCVGGGKGGLSVCRDSGGFVYKSNTYKN